MCLQIVAGSQPFLGASQVFCTGGCAARSRGSSLALLGPLRFSSAWDGSGVGATFPKFRRDSSRDGASLDMKTIAEGAEDSATLEALKTRGVDFAQGFYLGRP